MQLRKLEFLRGGFTLIEALVVVAVFGMMGVALTGIFLASFRASIKADKMAEVRQNGSQVMAVVSRKLRAATSVNCESGGILIPQVNYTEVDGTDSNFTCVTDENEIGRFQSTRGGVSEYLTSEEVEVENCVITCSGLGVPPAVTISFTVRQAVEGSDPTETASSDFRTQVTLRDPT